MRLVYEMYRNNVLKLEVNEDHINNQRDATFYALY